MSDHRDRRIFQRAAKRLALHYRLLVSSESLPEETSAVEGTAMTLNVSAGGASFHAKDRLPVTGILEISLSLSQPKAMLRCSAQVVRCQPGPRAAYYDTAVCFLNLAQKDQQILKQLVGQEER